jgi:hypothetical protein
MMFESNPKTRAVTHTSWSRPVFLLGFNHPMQSRIDDHKIIDSALRRQDTPLHNYYPRLFELHH